MSWLAPRRIRPRAGLVVLVVVVAAAVDGTVVRSGAAVIAPAPNPTFTLKSVDQKCFYAARPAGGWPFLPQTQIRPIRGGFNDVRSPVHDGVDVEAPSDHAPVYAIDAGTIANETAPNRPNGGTHLDVIDAPGHSYTYWHITWPSSLVDGVHVRRGQLLGHIDYTFWHVHISETVAGCGLVDPRRPTGLLRDPANTESPAIGPLAAYDADSAAYSFTLGATSDPSTPVPLGALTGIVDLRAAVTDTPHDATRQFVQLPLAAAAIRGYLAPAGSTNSHLGPISVYDGSQFILNTYGSSLGYQQVWAFGTNWSNTCFFTPGTTCAANYIYHTAGAGFDTSLVPNGAYQWCVQALTIAGVSARRCTAVAIAN
jgi:hypothetical protein